MARGMPSPSITTMPIVTVTRRLRFNAAHRLHNPALSDDENAALFGKCNNPNWHGHNYILEVAVEGPIDERTGYVIDLSTLKSIVQREVIDRVDHRNLNELPPFDEELNPSAENLARFILEYLNGRVGDDRVQVYKVRCFETPTSVATYQI